MPKLESRVDEAIGESRRSNNFTTDITYQFIGKSRNLVRRREEKETIDVPKCGIITW